jgi:hypothetical protein
VNNEVLLGKLSEFLMVEQCGWQLYRVVGERATDAELHRTILTGLIRDLGGGPNYVSPTARLAQAKSEALLASAVVSGPVSEAEHLGWAQTKLAELDLKAIMDQPPPDPERLGRVVIEPDLAIKEIHAAPIDKRSLSDGAKVPSVQETPTSRTSPGA